MSKFFISLGITNKKMLFPLIYIILYIFVNIYNNNINIENNEVFIFIDGFGFSLGELSSFFVGQIIKYRRICLKKKKKSKKQLILDYLYLFLINFAFTLMRLISLFFIKKEKEEDTDNYDLLINDALVAIIMTIITRFALKYKYYIHHIISLILIVILSVIMDLVLGHFSRANVFTVINSILYVLSDSILYLYYKYLMEKKYYNFTDILFVVGIFDSVLFSLSLGIILIEQKIRRTYKMIFLFYEYYKTHGTWIMVSIFLVGLIPKGFILIIYF